MERKISIYFLEPIDPELDGCPTYFDVIKNPMDLGTAKNKLEEGKYLSVDEWIHDIQLIWENCILFNQPETYFADLAYDLQKEFISLLEEYSLNNYSRTDWVKQLVKLGKELDSSITDLSQHLDLIPKRSPSIISLTPSPSMSSLDFSMEDIIQLGEDLKSLTEREDIIRIRNCLKSLEPQYFTKKNCVVLDISRFPRTTLFALKQEFELIQAQKNINFL